MQKITTLKYLKAVGIVVGLTGLYFLCRYTSHKYYLYRAKNELVAIRHGIAAHYCDKIYESLDTSIESCEIGIAAYHFTLQMNKLEFVAQSCLKNRFESSDIYTGLASVFEHRGNVAGGKALLLSNLDKFKTRPEYFYKIGILAKKLQQEKEASEAYRMAASLAPKDLNLQLEVFNYFYQNKNWPLARETVDRIDTRQIDNPYLLLMFSRTLFQLGDTQQMDVIMRDASVKLNQLNEEVRNVLKSDFKELFEPRKSKNPFVIPPFPIEKLPPKNR